MSYDDGGNTNGNGHAPETQNGAEHADAHAAPPCVITITFQGPGSAEFAFEASKGVSPAQIYALRGWLDLFSAKVFNDVQSNNERKRQPGLVVPVGLPMRPGRA